MRRPCDYSIFNVNNHHCIWMQLDGREVSSTPAVRRCRGVAQLPNLFFQMIDYKDITYYSVVRSSAFLETFP
jgi:hypothetical protein